MTDSPFRLSSLDARFKRANSEMGLVPAFISASIARAKVRKLEKDISRFRVRTTSAFGRLSTECGRQSELQAAVLAAREAVRQLPEVEREVLLRKVEEAERRLEAIRPICALPRGTDEPAAMPPGATELSGQAGTPQEGGVPSAQVPTVGSGQVGTP
ncbi:MAG TPA: hypothetical protein VNO22_10295 [Planctomycetota bacterium]|nr:hypothetical protein [Planctomycetota bacterium]